MAAAKRALGLVSICAPNPQPCESLTVKNVADRQRLHCRHRPECLGLVARQSGKHKGFHCGDCDAYEVADAVDLEVESAALATIGLCIRGLADLGDEAATKVIGRAYSGGKLQA